MTTRTTVALLLLLCLAPVRSQDMGVQFSVGVASFEMNDLKILQEHILSTYPVEGKITSSFPVFTFGEFGVVKQMSPTLRLGGGYGIATTGGKCSYRDYSGSIVTEIQANSHRLGGYASYSLVDVDWLGFSMYGRAALNISQIEAFSSLYVGSLGSTNTDKYRSFSPDLSAGGELLFRLGDVELGLEGGYLFNLSGQLANTDSRSDLVDPGDPDRVLSADWTGFRAGLKVIVWTR
ncbi:MAG: hypothetical protein R2751_02160 [Bacteroidales bacterium]